MPSRINVEYSVSRKVFLGVIANKLVVYPLFKVFIAKAGGEHFAFAQ